MSIVLIARALEKHMASLTPRLDIAPENGTYQPKADTPFQRLNVIPALTTTRNLTRRFQQEDGDFQIVVCYPSGTGAVQARSRAEIVRLHFPHNLKLTEGDITVEILGEPSVRPPIVQDGWYCIPIRVAYRVIVTVTP